MRYAADVSAVLAGMNLLLVPSVLHEAFGMVVLDAMLHGLPVIVSEAGALAEAAAGAAAAVLPVNMVSFPTTQRICSAGDGNSTRALEATGSAAAAEGAQLTAANGANTGVQAGHCTCSAEGCSTGSNDAHGSHHTGQPSTGCCSCWLAGQRSWEQRQYACLQQEHVDRWSSAVMGRLSSREAYIEASRRSRAAAQAVVEQGGQQLEGLLAWLQR